LKVVSEKEEGVETATWEGGEDEEEGETVAGAGAVEEEVGVGRGGEEGGGVGDS